MKSSWVILASLALAVSINSLMMTEETALLAALPAAFGRGAVLRLDGLYPPLTTRRFSPAGFVRGRPAAFTDGLCSARRPVVFSSGALRRPRPVLRGRAWRAWGGRGFFRRRLGRFFCGGGRSFFLRFLFQYVPPWNTRSWFSSKSFFCFIKLRHFAAVLFPFGDGDILVQQLGFARGQLFLKIADADDDVLLDLRALLGGLRFLGKDVVEPWLSRRRSGAG